MQGLFGTNVDSTTNIVQKLHLEARMCDQMIYRNVKIAISHYNWKGRKGMKIILHPQLNQKGVN